MTAAVCGAALIIVTLSLVLKSYGREFSLMLSVCGAVMLLIAALREGTVIFDTVSSLTEISGIDEEHISALLKSVGIALAVQFTADTCRDAGETSIANKTELFGRVMILIICLPVFEEVLSLASAVLSYF